MHQSQGNIVNFFEWVILRGREGVIRARPRPYPNPLHAYVEVRTRLLKKGLI